MDIQKQAFGISNKGKEHKKAELAATLIHNEGLIHRFELMDKLGLTLAQMIPFNQYLVYFLEGKAEYNKQSKTWKWIVEVEAS